MSTRDYLGLAQSIEGLHDKEKTQVWSLWSLDIFHLFNNSFINLPQNFLVVTIPNIDFYRAISKVSVIFYELLFLYNISN